MYSNIPQGANQLKIPEIFKQVNTFLKLSISKVSLSQHKTYGLLHFTCLKINLTSKLIFLIQRYKFKLNVFYKKKPE